MAVTECTGIGLDAGALADSATSADCFEHEHVKASFRSLKTRSVDILDATAHAEQPKMPAFHSRIQGRQTTCSTSRQAVVVGDGNPHQNFIHKQITVSNAFHDHQERA
jgi:hypothetical protein